MRLIDADKLKPHDISPFYSNIITTDDIEYADTVEAIPIEWLLNHLEVGNEAQNDNVYHLIELWRKENGVKESDRSI